MDANYDGYVGPGEDDDRDPPKAKLQFSAPFARDLADISMEYRQCICFGCAEKIGYVHQDKGYVMCSRECVKMAESLKASSSDRTSNAPSHSSSRATNANIVVTKKGKTADVLKTTLNVGQGGKGAIAIETNVKKRESVSSTMSESEVSSISRDLAQILKQPPLKPIEYGQDGVKGDLLPPKHGKDIIITSKLVDGATVKIVYFWSTKKILICAVEDEDTIYGSLQMDIDNLVAKYESDLTLNHIPIQFDYYLGKYYGQWYRGVVTKCNEDRSRVHFEFVDLGDNAKLAYTDLRMLTQKLMNKHPVYSKSFGLFNVPSPSSADPEGFRDYLDSRVTEVFIGIPLKLDIIENTRKINLTDEKTGKTLSGFYYSELMAFKNMIKE